MRVKDVHPTKTARSGQVPGQESNYVYCRQCGFTCNTKRDAVGTGDGISLDTSSYSRGDPVVSSGCPGCGSKNYR